MILIYKTIPLQWIVTRMKVIKMVELNLLYKQFKLLEGKKPKKNFKEEKKPQNWLKLKVKIRRRKKKKY